jgi:hypothetical protein
MSYIERPKFDQPTAEDVQRSQRTMMWILPGILLQQGLTLMRGHGGVASRLLSTLSWTVVTISVLWLLVGWPLRWLSQRDQDLLNDDWNRAVRDAATRWGLIAVVLIGCALMLAQVWVDVGTTLAISLIVGGGLSVAGLRHAWLNRGEAGHDE